MSLPFAGAFSGAEVDEAILKVRTTLLAGIAQGGSGQVNGPSLSFSTEINSGLYRAAAGDIRLAVLGHDKTSWGVNSITNFKPLLMQDGALGVPSIAFVNSPASGLYRAGVGDVRFAVLGSDIAKFQTTAFEITQPLRASSASVARPGISFTDEVDMGFYRATANETRLAIVGADHFVFGRYTQNSHTNQAMMGIGIAPSHPLTVSINAAASLTTCVLRNENSTDGNGCVISIRSTTTGVGGVPNIQMCGFQGITVTHDHATRAGKFQVFVTNAAATEFWEFKAGQILQSQTGSITIGTGAANGDITLSPNGSGRVTLDIAKPLRIAIGTNQRAGDAILVGGTVTVANTTVTANTKVIVSRKVSGGTLGFLTYTVSAGTSFTITSSSATETSTVTYWLIEVN